MFRRREPVPFAFVAEADRSAAMSLPRPERAAGQIAGRRSGLTMVAGLVGP